MSDPFPFLCTCADRGRLQYVVRPTWSPACVLRAKQLCLRNENSQ